MINLEVSIKDSSRDNNGLLNMLIKNMDINKSSNITINTIQLFYTLKFVPDEKSLDILFFSIYIHLIDNLLPRDKLAVDNWQREIKVKIPVSEPLRWNQNVNTIIEALNFLTGDEWNIEFYELREQYFLNEELDLADAIQVENICLLSGGLDSLVGAIDLVQESDNILFVAHYDGAGANSKDQKNIFDTFKSNTEKNIYLSQFHIYDGEPFYEYYNKKKNRTEPIHDGNLRARSLLFLGFALFHAINFNVDHIFLPENGLISINIPLNESRSSSNSTRTTHPYFIKKLQRFLSGIGISVEIKNLYQCRTKGEMLADCKNKSLLNNLINRTISCSHSKRKGQWTRRKKSDGTQNCGYCIPCLIRKSSIYHYGGLETIEKYGVDLNPTELKLNKDSKKLSAVPTDLLALINFLNKKYDLKKYEREITLIANIENKQEIVEMLDRGYNELRKYIEENASDEVKRLLI
jgi:7-cyano-7-deazaguanine synthase in queuosine biosynthesis